MTTNHAPVVLRDRVKALKAFAPDQLAALVAGSTITAFSPGASNMQRGTDADHFAVVLGGEVEATSIMGGTGDHSTVRLKAGDTFNELALMTGDPVLADFTAINPLA